MVIAILRDSFFGVLCRLLTGGGVFKYPEELQPSIWKHYLADDDPFFDTIGVAVTSPIIPQLPPKNPRRNSQPTGDSSFHRQTYFDEEKQDLRSSQYPPLPPEPPEAARVRRSRRPSEESVGRSVWLNNKPSSATLVPEWSYLANGKETGGLESIGGQSTHRLREDYRFAPKVARVSNSRSADTLVSPALDEEAAYPPISPRTSSKKAVRTTVHSDGLDWRNPYMQSRNSPSRADNKNSASVKRYFIGFEFFKYISCMVFVGSEKTVTVSSSRPDFAPRPAKRPKFTGDRRSNPKRRLSDEIPLREVQNDKPDVEKGVEDSEGSWHSNGVIHPDWEVDRRAGLYIVGWYGSDDPENPRNWSAAKKLFVTFEVCLLTFSVYVAAAIYSSAVTDFARAFGVSPAVSIYGLTLFVAGYGLGPMLLSPLSEVPAIGRTSIYIVTLAIFVALQVPTALATNISTLLALRFLAGFAGSPCLATGAASIADMFIPTKGAYGIAFWGLFAICGPTLGPLIGGFVVEARGRTWIFVVIFLIASFTLLILFFLLPETSAANILHKRANRLRKLTGNQKLVCEADIASYERGFPLKEMLMNTLVRPFTMPFTEPIVLALDLYAAFIYGLLFMWFESFPIVFVEIYGFGLGTSGLMFLGILIGAILTLPAYFWWLRTFFGPKAAKHGKLVPEWALPPCYVGAITLPVCLFWFGWTSRPDIHWIVPVIGTAFFSVAVVLLFNALFNYLVLAYPKQAATVLAGNVLSRCILGATFPLFATDVYRRLGVAWSTSVLGFIALAFTPIPFILVKYGKWLRHKSKMARHDV
ncbi:hypothetical protein diail_602 [Diaporthe ilicicola]|nr:hypothetical protein diail_602 [Diaporthe ilicicola]